MGRDAQSAFNTVRQDHVGHVLRDYGWLWEWIVDWLGPRTFTVDVDGVTLGTTAMTGGTPQGSPLSPTLFTVYMSSVVWDTERRLL